MVSVERVVLPGQVRKLPHPKERFHMEEIASPEYHLYCDPLEDNEHTIAEAIEQYTQLQESWLARQEALCKQRWNRHTPAPRVTPPTDKQLNMLAMVRGEYTKRTGSEWPEPIPISAMEVSQQIDAVQAYNQKGQTVATARVCGPGVPGGGQAMTVPVPTDATREEKLEAAADAITGDGLVKAREIHIDGYDAKLQQWFTDVVKDLEKATGSPVRVRRPSSEADFKDLCKELTDERKRLGATRPAGSKWSGHEHPDYAQGVNVAAKDKHCHYEHCDAKSRKTPRGRALTSDEWDWSIRNHGRPLCRSCQKVAPSG